MAAMIADGAVVLHAPMVMASHLAASVQQNTGHEPSTILQDEKLSSSVDDKASRRIHSEKCACVVEQREAVSHIFEASDDLSVPFLLLDLLLRAPAC